MNEALFHTSRRKSSRRDYLTDISGISCALPLPRDNHRIIIRRKIVKPDAINADGLIKLPLPCDGGEVLVLIRCEKPGGVDVIDSLV